MLFIDPATCIDCGACVPECPIDAIKPDHEVDDVDDLLKINASYYDQRPAVAEPKEVTLKRTSSFEALRVAVVGSGPAAQYAIQALLSHKGAQVDMFERLPVPYGLIRSGVAPDHAGTKNIVNVFRSLGKRPGFRMYLGVEIGNHLSHSELSRHYHAVIYAVGASADRALGISGETKVGSCPATEFVGWYNGHPDYSALEFDLSSERAVVVGNGNVALDIARILTSRPDDLANTDIADHALEALRKSNIQEVIVLGRRGPAQASYTNTEFLALMQKSDIDVRIDPTEATLDEHTLKSFTDGTLSPTRKLKADLAVRASGTPSSSGRKSIVFRYGTSPTKIVGEGEGEVEGVEITRNEMFVDANGEISARMTENTEFIETGLLIRSVGYRGTRLDELPFDEERGVFPNEAGRVLDPTTALPVRGVYATGWIKRGPSGSIGSNRKCAKETVSLLLDDFEGGVLPPPPGSRDDLDRLLQERQPKTLDFTGWMAIDKAERVTGAKQGRPRVKITDIDELLAVGMA